MIGGEALQIACDYRKVTVRGTAAAAGTHFCILSSDSLCLRGVYNKLRQIDRRADLRDYDERRLSSEPFPDVPPCTHDEMWARLQWTLDRIGKSPSQSAVAGDF